ncbi:DsbA family protein [Novosphingobium sp.]|uniref:DsbA family protein n=1 Tax=Novosphingobium sp. TaxID=1874826 RepID=UPI00356ADB23
MSSWTNSGAPNRRSFWWYAAAFALLCAPLAAQGRETAFPAMSEEVLAPKTVPKVYDVTVIVFSDYGCPYCKKLHGTLAQLLARDPKVRIVWRDWPIFGGASLLAARAAIASQWQGKHSAFNAALFAQSGRMTDASVQAAAKAAKLDWPRLQQDIKTRAKEIDRVIARSNAGATALNFEGTPGMLIGNARFGGAASLTQLMDAVAQARKDGVG